jgi:hypothetical protein
MKSKRRFLPLMLLPAFVAFSGCTKPSNDGQPDISNGGANVAAPPPGAGVAPAKNTPAVIGATSRWALTETYSNEYHGITFRHPKNFVTSADNSGIHCLYVEGFENMMGFKFEFSPFTSIGQSTQFYKDSATEDFGGNVTVAGTAAIWAKGKQPDVFYYVVYVFGPNKNGRYLQCAFTSPKGGEHDEDFAAVMDTVRFIAPGA